MNSSFDIEGIKIGGGAPLVLIAGPCVLESEELADTVCRTVKDITRHLGIGYIFKSSYDKANRQSIDSFRGPGIDRGLEILSRLRERYNVPVLTDVHSPEEALKAGEHVDVLQIPAFLCRQTDLALACGKTGKPVLIKKGQFMPPWRMISSAQKVEKGGSDRIILTERGTAFGYGDNIVDMRSLVIMKKTGCPVVYDCTHSIQQLTTSSETSSGNSDFIEPLARAAVAVGIDGVFIETHPDCPNALCDKATMLPLDRLENLLKQLIEIDSCMNR
ncbi:3-deoxy-8-phosphooctulonate synthase [Candidatus Latescibacterota bacterium]